MRFLLCIVVLPNQAAGFNVVVFYFDISARQILQAECRQAEHRKGSARTVAIIIVVSFLGCGINNNIVMM